MKNIFFVLIIIVHFTSKAQSIENHKIHQIDSLFSEWDKLNSPGCILGIIKDGNFIYQRGYGSANLEHNIPISSNIVFDIGSMSKQFTSTAIILLQQQGKLSLDDSVRKYIPELPWYGKTMTIRQMLNHTSGLRDYNSLLTLSGKQEEQVTTKEDALNIIIKQKDLNFKIGEEWDYSNTGFFLASVIVERVSGLSMKEFSEKNIFNPLGMENTFYLDNHATIVPYRATAYAPNEIGGFQINMSNWEQTGDGAIQTNCNDLLLWDKNYYWGAELRYA
jgi:CubicO group peptidase (beta-lactamase class C family)